MWEAERAGLLQLSQRVSQTWTISMKLLASSWSPGFSLSTHSVSSFSDKGPFVVSEAASTSMSWFGKVPARGNMLNAWSPSRCIIRRWRWGLETEQELGHWPPLKEIVNTVSAAPFASLPTWDEQLPLATSPDPGLILLTQSLVLECDQIS